ncbi:hypothetical protein [Streptomyces sp. ME19-01-6]|uniref:hypothetical protein n=1 Tax=Streptomyces sp. ME19-01-6 TaxID=3028686 RepID=UPI0029A7207F|nr:hypothetical protein [Streptomyces sp. ME19-01-6]MDX3225400.1 hypothetical protein [Streptomyces sp. ME19-01-6]
MRRLWARVWLRHTALVVLVIALVAVFVVANRDSDGGHLAANRAQLRKACDGTLPYADLKRLVRDGRAGELSQHGTMLEPGQESRSLLDCELSWGDGYGVTVHAEALVSDVPEGVETDDLLGTAGADGTYVAPGTTGQYGRRGAWLVAECVDGLRGRVRPTTDLYVAARVTDGDSEADSAAEREELARAERAAALTGFRTAVHVANAITKAQGCGSTPLKAPTEVLDTYESHDDNGDWRSERIEEPGRDLRKCGWINARSLPGVMPGAWTTLGDLQESGVVSACQGTWDSEAEENDGRHPADWQITGVEAASWAGILGRTAYDAYEREGHVPGWGVSQNQGKPAGDGKGDGSVGAAAQGEDRISSYVEDPQLALWARSVCGGRETYHRVSVMPSILIEDGATAILGAKDRAQLSRTARTALNRYLSAADGWPKAAGCRDTKVLGEVEEWH